MWLKVTTNMTTNVYAYAAACLNSHLPKSVNTSMHKRLRRLRSLMSQQLLQNKKTMSEQLFALLNVLILFLVLGILLVAFFQINKQKHDKIFAEICSTLWWLPFLSLHKVPNPQQMEEILKDHKFFLRQTW